jgi:hypothetical protein
VVPDDVELTNEEQQIFAEIESFEDGRRPSARSWRTRAAMRLSKHNSPWPWIALTLGITVLAGGLAAGLPAVAFGGFVVLLEGTSQLCARTTSATWFPRPPSRLRRPNSDTSQTRDL